MVVRLLRRRSGSVGWPTTRSICSAVRGRLAGPGSSRSTACATRPSTSSWPTAPIRWSAGHRTARARGNLDEPRRDLDEAVPRRLLILGAGPVGVEMASGRAPTGRRGGHHRMAAHVLGREACATRVRRSARCCTRDGVELVLSSNATEARRDGDDYVLELDDGQRAARRPAARRNRPSTAGEGNRPRDGRRRSPTRMGSRSTRTCWRPNASGRSATSTGLALTHVGKYQGEVVAATSSASRARPTTRRCRGSSTPTRRPPPSARLPVAYSATVPISGIARSPPTPAPTPNEKGFLTLLSDGERLTGAYALGPESGEWLQQATLAIRTHLPLDVLADTIQPFPPSPRSTSVPSRSCASRSQQGRSPAARKPPPAATADRVRWVPPRRALRQVRAERSPQWNIRSP